MNGQTEIGRIVAGASEADIKTLLDAALAAVIDRYRCLSIPVGIMPS